MILQSKMAVILNALMMYCCDVEGILCFFIFRRITDAVKLRYCVYKMSLDFDVVMPWCCDIVILRYHDIELLWDCDAVMVQCCDDVMMWCCDVVILWCPGSVLSISACFKSINFWFIAVHCFLGRSDPSSESNVTVKKWRRNNFSSDNSPINYFLRFCHQRSFLSAAVGQRAKNY